MAPLLLRSTAPVIVGGLALLSLFVLLRAHDAPGGGFSGGLILASAVAIELLAHGVQRARARLRLDPRTLVATGLIAVAGAALVGPIVGRPLLATVSGPYIPGVAKISSTLVFDLGIYLIVAGTALAIVFVLVEDD